MIQSVGRRSTWTAWAAGCTLVATVLLATGCALYQDVTVQEVEGLEGLQISADGVSGQIRVRLHNPNRYTLQVVETDLGLWVESDRLATIALPQSQALPPRSDVTLSLAVQTEPGALGSLLRKHAMDLLLGRPLPLRLEGSVAGKVGWVRMEVPVNAEYLWRK